MTISEDTFRLLTLQHLKGVGNVTLTKLATNPAFRETNTADVARLMPNLASKLDAAALDDAERAARTQADAARSDGAMIVSLLDDTYPPLLRATFDAPAVLYVKGRVQPQRCLAVIGTREPTRHGEVIAQRLTEHFASRAWSVISGLALGVDGLAHRAALDAGGHTVAVLAHGLHTVAPRGHAALARDILDAGGALVTEYGYGVNAFPPQFVKRDRVQAGLAQGVVLVQTDVTGGSWHASRASVEYGRVLAYPQPTRHDREANAPKIQGLLELERSASAAAAQLKCSPSALERVYPLASRDDYPRFEDALNGPLTPGSQASLF
ncbi:DNA-processing protein DprA [Deinococcus yavapaiensis]|uniref:DNA processing protein n=1 Tax=Deinococcus yavapaiensis KR-236 TaxID=694435 RepID=A0A318S2E4_9DEIO|nr:DNA-processing protein DprA [Deinococcus yavapaiensis]PYE52007.1 DNA processing protein [Deinococcus yavapaiensis KR-236]